MSSTPWRTAIVAPAGARRPNGCARIRPVLGVVRDFVMHVLVEPVRHGRLRSERWPRGLGPVAAIALAGYVLAAFAVVAAKGIREASELSASAGSFAISLPAWTVGPLLALVVLALALAQTAALRVPLWLALIVTVLSSLVMISVGVNDTAIDTAVTPGRVAAALATIALWVILFVAPSAPLLLGGVRRRVRRHHDRHRSGGLDDDPRCRRLRHRGGAGHAGLDHAEHRHAGVSRGARRRCSGRPAVVLDGDAVRRVGRAPAAAGRGCRAARRRSSSGAGGRSSRASPRARSTRSLSFLSAILLLAAVAGSWVFLGRMRGTRSRRPPAAALESRFGQVAQGIAALLVIGILPSTILLHGDLDPVRADLRRCGRGADRGDGRRPRERAGRVGCCGPRWARVSMLLAIRDARRGRRDDTRAVLVDGHRLPRDLGVRAHRPRTGSHGPDSPSQSS